MKHKVRVTVLKKNLYPELQQAYCADPHAGPCPCYHEGDVFEFYRDGSRDDFWHMGANTLVRTKGDKHCGRRPPAAVLLRGLGRHRPVHLHGLAGRLHHSGVDEGGKHHDRLLL